MRKVSDETVCPLQTYTGTLHLLGEPRSLRLEAQKLRGGGGRCCGSHCCGEALKWNGADPLLQPVLVQLAPRMR